VNIKKLKIESRVKTFLLPIIVTIIFFIFGVCVFAFKQKIQYFFLFFGMGLGYALCECVVIFFPKYRQAFRRITQGLIGGSLLFGISISLRVNFQFSELVFDAFAIIVTGALIQFIIARLIMPFIVGNAFCSWVCWDGAIFELTQKLLPKSKSIKDRSGFMAIGYLIFIVLLATVVSQWRNPALDKNQRIWWIIGENIFLLTTGFTLSYFWGRRAYCRIFCPFITLSGVVSRFSIFKITPVNSGNCTGCGKCNKACPMLIDVSSYVKDMKRINNRSCILCEQCVSSCNNECIKLTPDLPWK
jgi:ferredoxin-type protein NapH